MLHLFCQRKAEQIRTSDLDALIFFIRRKELDTDTHARSAFQLEVRQGSCELRNAIRGMPGSEFEPRSPLQSKSGHPIWMP